MKDKKIALYAIAFILIGGLLASPSMQLNGLVFAQDDTNEDIDEEAEEIDVAKDETDDYSESDEYHDSDDYEMDSYEEHREKADKYCEMTEEEREAYLAEHEDMREYKEKLNEYCTLDESDREQYIRDRMEEYREKMTDKMHDKKSDFDRYCEMTDKEREEFRAMHDKMTDEMRERHDRYCSMTVDERTEFMKEYHDMMKDNNMKDYVMDQMGHDQIRDFDMRIAAMCDMSDERKRMMMQKYEFVQEHHERIAEYCTMSAEDREKFRMTHQDMMEDFREDMAQEHDKMMDAPPGLVMKMHDKLRDYKISDERHDAILEKFRMKHADLTDAQRDEIRDKLKAKYMDHVKVRMSTDPISDLQKDQILKRIAEMRDYKADLRQKYKNMSEDERINFQAEFRDKVSDKRFAWISPHKQMKAGISVDELECREGLNLVLKTSNGKAMCVKSATAERLIQSGHAVPAA